MSKRRIGDRLRLLGGVLTLVSASLVLTGCCLVTPQPVDPEGQESSETEVPDAIPILVTLAADESEALTAARTRVLAELESVMPPEVFATVRVYGVLPVLAFSATPEVIALVLRLPDVRSVEADRTLSAAKGER